MEEKPKRKSLRNSFIDEIFGEGSEALPRDNDIFNHPAYDHPTMKGIKGGKKPYLVVSNGETRGDTWNDHPAASGVTVKSDNVDWGHLRRAGKIMIPYEMFYPKEVHAREIKDVIDENDVPRNSVSSTAIHTKTDWGKKSYVRQLHPGKKGSVISLKEVNQQGITPPFMVNNTGGNPSYTYEPLDKALEKAKASASHKTTKSYYTDLARTTVKPLKLNARQREDKWLLDHPGENITSVIKALNLNVPRKKKPNK